MRAPMVQSPDGFGPDLPEGFRGTATLTADGDYLLTPADPSERIAALEVEVRGMRDRVAAVEATGDAAKLRDAVRGPS